MNQESIGINAGLIWNALCEPKSLSIKALKKVTKLKEKELLLALGWLSREGKINFDESDEEIYIVLV